MPERAAEERRRWSCPPANRWISTWWSSGAGPAGPRDRDPPKQVAAEAGGELSVVVVEKGSEVGAHILSGAVIDPIGLDRLLPGLARGPGPAAHDGGDARTSSCISARAAACGCRTSFMPKLMDNHGNFVGSLGNVARYLGRKAEALGVEIYPGFAGRRGALDEEGRVVGIATGDMGIGRDGRAAAPTSPAAWSCAPSTRSSPKARAAA